MTAGYDWAKGLSEDKFGLPKEKSVVPGYNDKSSIVDPNSIKFVSIDDEALKATKMKSAMSAIDDMCDTDYSIVLRAEIKSFW